MIREDGRNTLAVCLADKFVLKYECSDQVEVCSPDKTASFQLSGDLKLSILQQELFGWT